ncbi:MAG: hypothetical protein GEV09_07320 [Pseudonocardiaceae bacterium]|nr:hypothetical protein [Pseudonocardiaceae bacterium]
MAGRDVASRHVAEYVAAVASELPGPRRIRTAALAELRDGLCDAVDARRQRGLASDAAAREAVAESGPPDIVAAAYAPVLADLTARRTALILLATGPVIGMLWVLALTPERSPGPLLGTAPVLPLLVATAAVAAVLTLAVTGAAQRLLGDVPQLPQLAVATACVAAVCADVAVLGLATSRALTDPGVLPWIVTLAAAASALRLAGSSRAAHHFLRTATRPG